MSRDDSGPSESPEIGSAVTPGRDDKVAPPLGKDEARMPPIGDAELGALHIRVIALEGLVTALLADASDDQIERARQMARYIAPREGHTPHPLTIHAADHMMDLIGRSARFGSGQLPRADDIQ